MATRPNILATLEHEGDMRTVVIHDDAKQATTTLTTGMQRRWAIRVQRSASTAGTEK